MIQVLKTPSIETCSPNCAAVGEAEYMKYLQAPIVKNIRINKPRVGEDS